MTVGEVAAEETARMDELELLDLLNDLQSLAAMLHHEIDRGCSAAAVRRSVHVLDAFLIAAGMCQIVEDHLHRQPRPLEAIGRRVRRRGRRATAGVLSAAAGGAGAYRTVVDTAAARWHAELRTTVSRLAAYTMEGGRDPSGPASVDGGLRDVLDSAARLVGGLGDLPDSLRSAILRLPDGFRTFDQRPEDCDRLAARFALSRPDRKAPLLVVGVRTSGSYLAPLQADSLRAIGYRSVDWMTYRPGHGLLRSERRQLEMLRRNGGSVLVIDDPPVTGNKLGATADMLAGEGVPVVLLVPLLGEAGAVPEQLTRYAVVALPWSEWAFHGHFGPPALGAALGEMLRGRTIRVPSLGVSTTVTAVGAVRRVDLAPIADIGGRPLTRSHMRCQLQVDINGTAGSCSLDVYVKGTGLGYFGRHSAILSRRLGKLVPEVYGWHDGFLFRRMLPEDGRLISSTTPTSRNDAEAIADYVACRGRSLAAPEDRSLRLRKRRPVWEMAGDALASGYGRAAPVAAPLMRRAAIRMLECPAPAVVDGSAGLAHWFRDGREAGLLKVDYDERAFSVWDHYCYDPVWDLAVAAADHAVRLARTDRAGDFAVLVRKAYEARTRQTVEGERWFLYRTVYVLSLRRHFCRLLGQGVGQLQAHDGGPPPHPDVYEAGFDYDLTSMIDSCDGALARVRDQYLAELFLADAGPASAGPSCAVSLDAELGYPMMGGPALSRAGAVGLRALLLHEFRPSLLTTGSTARREQQTEDFGVAARNPHDPAPTPVSTLQDIHNLIGHIAGTCAVCREPQLSPASQIVLGSLDGGNSHAVRRLAGTARSLQRRRF